MNKKIQVNGFLITCLKCGSNEIKLETRQDGTDFQCLHCGNKLIIRPGETFHLHINPKIVKDNLENKLKRFEDKLKEDVPMDDWPNEVLEKWISKQENNDE